MAIIKTHTADNGAPINYHRAFRADVDFDAGTVAIQMRSWTSREVWLLGAPTTWMWTIAIPIAEVNFANIDASLLTQPVFVGGTVIADGDASLEAAKARRWAMIKHRRSVEIDKNMATPFGEFQCKEEDRQNITNAVVLAQVLLGAGQPVAIDWTLADNTVVTMNATQLTGVGLLLGQKVQQAHAIARGLRAVIDAASTVEQVNAVVWPGDEVPSSSL